MSAKNESISRRDMLMGVVAAVLAPAVSSADAAELGAETWLRGYGGNVRDLATDLAGSERSAIEGGYPDAWQRVRYITVGEWTKGIFFCVGVAPPTKAEAMFSAAKSRILGTALRVLGAGWSDDRRVWSLIVRGDPAEQPGEIPGSVALLMHSIAPDLPTFGGPLFT